jgi:hypothetical protein
MPTWLLFVLGVAAGLAVLAGIVVLVIRAESRPKRNKSWLAPPSGDPTDSIT